jgi:N-acetylneuraminic acid mutarotase
MVQTTFEVNFPGMTKSQSVLTGNQGDFDVNDLVGFTSNSVSRGDMNHASEIYSFDLKKNTWKQITNVNTATYDSLALSKTEEDM